MAYFLYIFISENALRYELIYYFSSRKSVQLIKND